MQNTTDFRIAVFEGDGIGHEITKPCLRLMEKAAERTGGFSMTFSDQPCGAACYRDTGESLPKTAVAEARASDAILLAAAGLPEIRYPDGREIAPQVELRFELGLYAGVRPVRPIPGIRPILADPRAADMDFVIVRESTEGLFAPQAPAEFVSDDEVRETMVITRETSEKLFDFSFRLAESRAAEGRPATVTCVDKANVFAAFYFFRQMFEEKARAFPALTHDATYVDAFAMIMAQRPWTIGVAVTENMFGDILSDLGAAIMGGLGYAPSADIGDEHAVFQPCHGTAPDIVGKGLANPTAMILSSAMMLEWLGAEQGVEEAARAGRLIRASVADAFADGKMVTCELGGDAGTSTVFDAVAAAMTARDPEAS